MAKRSFIKNWQKIYFISLEQKPEIHKNIINQIINDYRDEIDFHVAYVPHERGHTYEETLFEIHTYLKEKLKKLEKSEKLEMSIVYNKHTDYHNNTTMAIWKNRDDALKKKGNIVRIQQYSRRWGVNEIQLENRKVRLGDEKGKYKYKNQERIYNAESLNMFPKDTWLLRGFLSSVAGEDKNKNEKNGNGGVYYKFVYKYNEEAPTIQRNNIKFEHADVPYNKFRIELSVDGKSKSETPYEIPKFITGRNKEKVERFFNNTVIRPAVNTGKAVGKAVRNIFETNEAEAEEAEEAEKAPAAGGKTRKHRKRKMRSSKRKATKKGRKSRKKKSSSRKKK